MKWTCCSSFVTVQMDANMERMLLEVPTHPAATKFDAWLHIQLLVSPGYFNRP